MNPLDVLKKEHEQIERELIELEEIMSCEVINYPNLMHVLKSLCDIWEIHEIKEENAFPILKKERIIIPVYTLLCEHREIRPHITSLKKAINSGSEFKVKQALENNGRKLIKKIRDHKDKEDEVFYAVTIDMFTPDEINSLNKILGSLD